VKGAAGLRVGLTGGIGCGKSTAGRMLAARGFQRTDTDRLVRELLEGDAEVLAALQGRWGDAVIAGDGGADRAAVAGRVFTDEKELKWLEGLLHPRVSARWQGVLAEAPEAAHVVEIPLLFEKNLEHHFDFVVCVETSRTLQAERLRDNGLSEAQVEARSARQLPLTEKLERADYVLSNTADRAFLEAQVGRLAKTLGN